MVKNFIHTQVQVEVKTSFSVALLLECPFID